MASIFPTIFSPQDLLYLQQHPDVLKAKASPSGPFFIELTDSIRSALSPLGVHLSHVTKIPMRWMIGDTPAHMDTGSKSFTKTFLVYLHDSTGEFIIGDKSYPITANTAFVFDEGLSHKTVGTGPRLLLGPMSESADPVGITLQSLNYFPTQYDAQNLTNIIFQNTAFYISNVNGYVAWSVDPTYTISTGYNSTPYTLNEDLPTDGYNPGDGYGQYCLYPVFLVYYGSEAHALNDVSQLANSSTSYTLGSTGGFSSWRIASNSTGSSSQSDVYAAGTTLTTGGTYFLYPNITCFLEGSTILCKVDEKDTYLPIQDMKVGTLVKTLSSGYKAVVLLGNSSLKNTTDTERSQSRLYQCSPSAYPELTDDLYITGGHSILVQRFTDKQRETTREVMGNIYITEGKARLMACIDERAVPWCSEGTYTIWHFALEHTDEHMNYGVWANGLLVETCSIYSMKNRSNMTFM